MDSNPLQQPPAGSQDDIVLSPELAQYTAKPEAEPPTSAPEPVTPEAEEPAKVEEQVKSEKAAKRARSVGRTSTKQHAEEEDTESEDGQSKQQKQLKRRRTTAGGSSPTLSAEHEARYLSLDDIPQGWTKPLLYFIQASGPPDSKANDKPKKTHRSADSARVKCWRYLPLRRVCNGSAWLTEVCSGTPGIVGHVDGPTAILRDLCAVVQAGHSPEDLELHPRGVATLNLANSRQEYDRAKSGTKFVLPATVKVGNEREFLHFMPLDLIAHYLTQQIRAMCKESNAFPSHIFAPELHVCQYAPSIALHLGASGLTKRFDALLAHFSDDEGRELLKQIEKLFNENVASKAGMARKRRGVDAGAQRLQTYTMDSSDVERLLQLCDKVEQKLEKLKPVKEQPSRNPLENKAYAEGEIIIKDVRAVLISRFTAALRHQIYDHYDISPQMIRYSDSEGDEEEQLRPIPFSVHSRFLDSAQVSFIDFTLNDSQEQYLMDMPAREKSSQLPASDADRLSLQFLLSNTSNDPNVKLVITAGHQENKADAVTELLVSLQAIKEITINESLSLPIANKKATWAEVAADSEENDATLMKEAEQ